MTDPFQDVSAAGRTFIEAIAATLEMRAAEPAMVGIVEEYLDAIPWSEVDLAVEVGCGTGAIARRMASRTEHGQVRGYEPSPEFVAHAQKLADGIANLAFEVADGAALPLRDASANAVVLHTVLCHVPRPAALLEEAMRVLKPGATLVVCDADFSKAALALMAGDPLQACAEYFAENFVTDRHLVGKLRPLVAEAGFQLRSFTVASRLVSESDGMASWVRLSGGAMVERGEIGQGLADALLAEYARRKSAGLLYGHQPFATAVAVKPA